MPTHSWKYHPQDDYYTCLTDSWYWVIYKKPAFFQLQRTPKLNRETPALVLGTFRKLTSAQKVVSLIEQG